jgi:hypothetical protein
MIYLWIGLGVLFVAFCLACALVIIAAQDPMLIKYWGSYRKKKI